MLALWIITLIMGVIMVYKAEKIADIWRSTEFSANTEGGKRRSQLMRRNGFWKFLGVAISIISIFLISGGDRLFVSKSTDAILNSTPQESDVIK